MAISDKLEYLNDTKQLLKEKINNLGGSIDDNTTFRNYANQLQNVYDNLPKTEYQEGTEINLGKTIKGKLDYENGVVGTGQSEQVGEPTPDNEVPIQCVTGNQDVVLIKAYETYQGSISASDGTEVSSNTRIRTDFIELESTSSITINSNNNTENRLRGIYYYNSNKAYISSYVPDGAIMPVTYTNDIPSNAIYYRVVFQKSDSTQTISPDGNYVIGDTTSYQLSLGEYEFNGIGNYTDELIYDVDEDRVYKKVNISKKILNTSNVTIFAYNDTNKYVNISKTSLNIPKGADIGISLCSHFREVTNTNDFIEGTYRTNGNVDNMWVKMPQSVTTIQEAQEYLNTYNATFYGGIRTPILEEITDTTLINQVKALYNAHSLNGTTIITSNGDLPLVIKARGLKGE